MFRKRVSLSSLALKANSGDQQAEKHLKKVFKNEGVFNEFMLYEEEAFDRRGEQEEEYLFANNIDAQKLMEIYLEVLCLNNNKFDEHGKLCMSEIMLCNLESSFGFFKKFIKIEIKKISKQLTDPNVPVVYKKKLEIVLNILKKRNSQKIRLFSIMEFVNNSYVSAYYDILNDRVFDSITPEEEKKIEDSIKKIQKGNKLVIVPLLFTIYIAKIKIFNIYFRVAIVMLNDYLFSLKSQKKQILNSLKNKKINYSFIKI